MPDSQHLWLEALDGSDQATTRIDPPHEPERGELPEEEPSGEKRRKARAKKQLAAAAETGDHRNSSIDLAETPQFIAEPGSDVPEIVIRHADDLATHLSERLREVERREIDQAEHQAELQLAEIAARAWVTQRDQELSAREREVQLREDEVTTRSAAIAAAEYAGEEQLRREWEEITKRSAEIDRRGDEIEQLQERLAGERAALQQASEKLRAERRREEELHRARSQQWQTIVEAEKAQSERAMANLQRHRAALDQRERAIQERENQLKATEPVVQETAATLPIPPPGIDAAVERAAAARDLRSALEHRWIAGQLWARLVDSGIASDEELHDSLEKVRHQLELLYRRERAAIEEVRASVLAAAKQCRTPPRGASAVARHSRPAKRKAGTTTLAATG